MRRNLALGVALCGCSVQLGAGGGFRPGAPPAAIWGAPAGANAHLGPAVIGVEAEGAADSVRGARWNLGLRAGWAPTPAMRGTLAAPEIAVEVGAPVQGASWGAGWYVGVTGAAAVWFWPRANEADRNRGSWFLRAIPTLMLFARARVVDDVRGGQECIAPEFTLGIAGRVRIVSDLVP
jgi:hypothetical protein